MWERFSFYGMAATLVVFLTAAPGEAGLGLDLAVAAALLYAYHAVVGLLAIPGGWLADRFIGTGRAVLAGGVVIAIGQYLLAIPATVTVHLGLILVALGAGLFQPSIATMVGELYDHVPDAQHAKRNAGFTVFYLGANLGAVIGVVVTVWLTHRYGWHLAFAATAIGMTVGMIQYTATRRMLGDVGRDPHHPVDEYRRSPTLRRAATVAVMLVVALLAATVLQAVATRRSLPESALLVIAPILVVAPVAAFRTMAREHTLTPAERSRIYAYIPIFLGATVFWTIEVQVGNLLADTVGHQWAIPLLIVILAPLFAVMWTRLGERAPSTAVMFAIGLLGIGLATVIMGLAGVSTSRGQLSALPLLSLALVPAFAELFLAPVGLSVTTRLAPVRFASQMMGLWFLAIATGQVAGGYLQRLNGTVPGAVYYGLLASLAVLAGATFVTAPRIKQLMAGVE
jgi:POT family proton-dependent oligopeptide transporter